MRCAFAPLASAWWKVTVEDVRSSLPTAADLPPNNDVLARISLRLHQQVEDMAASQRNSEAQQPELANGAPSRQGGKLPLPR
jgi:hypothetical protein